MIRFMTLVAAMFATSLVLVDSPYAQGSCQKGEKRLRANEECLPAVLFNYLYCLEKSGGGRVEVRRKEDVNKNQVMEIGLSGSGSGVIVKGEGKGGFKKGETERAIKELEEKLDPSLAAKCQAMAKAAAATMQRDQVSASAAITDQYVRLAGAIKVPILVQLQSAGGTTCLKSNCSIGKIDDPLTRDYV